MASLYKLQRCLALSNAALSSNQHTFTINID